ncbi:toll-like receptor 2 [Osmerus mordax]|uniref:toll-like receptor 2 n=1 Tax=Osmerus mordax TaxID=8014 RepID=UPI00350FD373
MATAFGAWRGGRSRSQGRLERLDLSANQLASLNADWFTGLLSLTHLNLLDNPYRSVYVRKECPWAPRPLFQGLLSLRTLRLGGPSLEELRSHDLAGVGRLDLLELHANHLRHYDPGSLSRPWPLGAATLSLREPFLTNQTLAEAVLDDVSYPETPLTLCDLQIAGNVSVRPFAAVARRSLRSLSHSNSRCYTLPDMIDALPRAVAAQTVAFNRTLDNNTEKLAALQRKLDRLGDLLDKENE